MTEFGSGGECFASAMTAALGPYEEFIDISAAEIFQTWHRRSGLCCLVCHKPVEVYQSSSKNPFVRHGKGHGIKVTAEQRKAAGETFQHQRFKYWVCHQLRELGVDAAVEPWQEGRRPDVHGTRDGRGYAVEIQWSPLAVGEARARTDHHLAHGSDEVLWLTRSCAWVERLPALGVKSFSPAGSNYIAHTGYLCRRGFAALAVEPVAVRDVLQAWVRGEIAWGYRDINTAGWATVNDWKRYTADLATEVDDMRAKLHAATTRATDQAQVIRNQRREIAALTAQRDEKDRALEICTAQRDTAVDARDTAAAERDDAHDQITALEQKLAEVGGRRDAAESVALVQSGQIRTVAAELASRTRYVKFLLGIAFLLALVAIAGWLS